MVAWRTIKTEEPKCNKGNFTPPPPHTHTVNAIEHQRNKKMATSPFLHQPTPFQGYPPFLAKFLVTPR